MLLADCLKLRILLNYIGEIVVVEALTIDLVSDSFTNGLGWSFLLKLRGYVSNFFGYSNTLKRDLFVILFGYGTLRVLAELSNLGGFGHFGASFSDGRQAARLLLALVRDSVSQLVQLVLLVLGVYSSVRPGNSAPRQQVVDFL